MDNQAIGQRIEQAQKNLQAAENEKIRLETQKQETEKQLTAACEEVVKLGYNPETIETDLKALEESLVHDLDELEKQIPKIEAVNNVTV